MNAVGHLVRLLPPAALLRLARQKSGRFDATPPVADAATCDDLAAAVEARYRADLADLLNACVGDDLERLATACEVRAVGGARQPALRMALWAWGARAEAGGADLIGTALQPAPRVLGGRLVHHAPARGAHPPSAAWPRPLPAPAPADAPPEEPGSIDELLAAADRAIGVRLGPRGRDKGAWGGRAAALLGVVERGDDAPDWRGDVELKTVPVTPEADGAWRIAEDPAIAMRGAAPIAKLQRVLWLVRASVGADDATILSWYLLAWDHVVARLVARYLHTRPKGPASTTGEAWYLHRRFFAEAGLLATLNGGGVTRMIVDELRVVGSPQTNRAMEAEFIRVATRALKRRPPGPRRDGTGQLVYPFDAELAQIAVAYLRTPTRVVRDLYRIRATRLEPLYKELSSAVGTDDRGWWRIAGGPEAGGRGGTGARGLSVEVRRVQDFAAGERQLVGTIKNAVIDGLRPRGVTLAVDAQSPDLLIVARLDDAGELVISLDLAGGSLSQRGWRIDAGEAPLREHLAAVMLIESRFDPRVDVLVDPLCGAGTIPIEAALAARAPARPLPLPTQALGPRYLTEPLFADAAPVVIGQDHDVGMLVAAKANAERAAADVVWSRGDATMLSREAIAKIAAERGRPAERGLILTNPPYGERLSAEEDDVLLALYADLGRAFRTFKGWRAGILSGHPMFAEAFGGAPVMRKPLANAQLRTYFYLYEL